MTTSASFDYPIQVLFLPGKSVDPNARIVFLVPRKLADIRGGIDLLVNTISFQHMTEENLEFYFDFVARRRVEWMYLVNRDLPGSNSYVKIPDYPTPDHYEEILRQPWFFSHHTELVLKYKD